MKSIKVGSLFSGIGAYEKACKNIGLDIDVKFYCEIDSVKSKAYSILHNISENKNLKDVTNVDLDRLEDIDLLFYSPPCQSYSVAGNKLGINDIRGTLFYDALKVIQHKKPKCCIMENVDNLPNKFSNVFNDMLECLDNSGYYNFYKIINAKDFLPQNRSRVFLISIRKDFINLDYNFNFPTGSKNYNWFNYININEGRELTGRQSKMVNLVLNNNIQDCIKIKGDIDFNQSTIMLRQSGLRFQNNNHFPTLCAAMGKGGGNFPMMAYNNIIKGLSHRQCFKLMGFDYEDSDLLTKNGFSASSQYVMAGDSVVVPILEGIIKELKNIL